MDVVETGLVLVAGIGLSVVVGAASGGLSVVVGAGGGGIVLIEECYWAINLFICEFDIKRCNYCVAGKNVYNVEENA